MQTENITNYVLDTNNINIIKQNIIASNYYLLSKFNEDIIYDSNANNDNFKSLKFVKYLSNVYNQNIQTTDLNKMNIDISWNDIRNNMGGINYIFLHIKYYYFLIILLFLS